MQRTGGEIPPRQWAPSILDFEMSQLTVENLLRLKKSFPMEGQCSVFIISFRVK